MDALAPIRCPASLGIDHLGVLGIEQLRSAAYAGGRSDVSISRGNFGSKVLCRRHNSDLPVLDTHARLLFLTQRLFHAEINRPGLTPEDEQIDISGDLLEQWLLKCLVAHAAAKIFTADTERLHPPDLAQAAALVFDETPRPNRWGLWMRHRPDIVLGLRREMAFQPIHLFDGHRLGGGSCSVGGHRTSRSEEHTS